MIPPPPRSTLFPYTTLFRSDQLRKEIETSINRTSAENGSNTPDFILAEFLTDCLAAFDKASMADRKSTRLNSSHVAISYAVFCLKKKKKKNKKNKILK